ncbi:MAG: peptide chain release factor N(5)-glutamine methyltransferase [Candidatus Chaera renei]|uniref:peptide chain release factor N(5)-glutamine methyltransferase n=1 Tax=Candidatus Chaera renei TaxID=2506947 RepID=A0A4Q0AJY3_9BACT|nr:MAG: peptide chain release factor N(5)-glutamine methyltransferase [Candidatus Chaera renei]
MLYKTIADWLDQASDALAEAGIDSARLDARLLAEHVLRRSREWLLARPEYRPSNAQLAAMNRLLRARIKRVPLAYLTGHKQFWNLDLTVSPRVLIPRPESEAMVRLALSADLPAAGTVIDVGTGSGCLAVAVCVSRPDLRIWACDISPAALKTARQNATKHAADIRFCQSDLLRNAKLPDKADLIMANLPYLAKGTEPARRQYQPELAYEPATALYARQNGLADIFRLLPQAARRLKPGGWLLLEAEPKQMPAIIKKAESLNLRASSQEGWALGLRLTTP